MSHILLGNTVRDLTSGFTGIAVNRNTRLNGTIQFSVQPKSTEANPVPDPISIDQNTLEVVDEGIASKATPQTYNANIPLGSKVKDVLSGVEGIAETRTDYLNGCSAYLVHHKSKDEKKRHYLR